MTEVRTGQKIKEMLKEKRISVIQLANAADLSRDTVYKAIRGERGLTVDSLTRIAKALGIHPSLLL